MFEFEEGRLQRVLHQDRRPFTGEFIITREVEGKKMALSYYADSEGKPVYGLHHRKDGTLLYVDPQIGISKNGHIREVEGIHYASTSEGNLQIVTGLQQINGQNRYFTNDGRSFTGWQTINGESHYFENSSPVAELERYHADYRTVYTLQFDPQTGRLTNLLKNGVPHTSSVNTAPEFKNGAWICDVFEYRDGKWTHHIDYPEPPPS